MHRPPAMAEGLYSAGTGLEARSNYLRAAVSFTPAYNDNVLPSQGTRPVRDSSFSISSAVSLDRTTPRLHEIFTYAPGFTAYRHTSDLNDMNHGFTGNVSYRTSEHSTVSVREYFSKSSSVFDASYSLSAPPPGTATSAPQGAIAPWANQIHNSTSGDISYQYARNRMLGASGAATQLRYLDQAEAGGMCDSDSLTGSGFYNIRLSEAIYTGAMYQYGTYGACSGAQQSDTKTHTVNLFLSYYAGHGFGISVSGGPQHYATALASLPGSSQWTPSLTANMMWQASRVNLVATYSRAVTGGGGLVGSFRSLQADLSARVQLNRRWTAAAGASYQSQTNVDPSAFGSNPGGHSFSGTASINRAVGEHVSAELQYQRLHQVYGVVASSAIVPDANRVSIAISYRFDRPLGR